MGISRPQQSGLDGFESPEPQHALFFALLPVPSAAIAAFSLADGLKRSHGLKGEPMDASRLHVTLHKLGEFVGAVPDELVIRARQAAARIQVQPFELMFNELLNLGNPADPVVALAGGNSAQVVAPLWQALRLALAGVGIKSPAMLATPHMTLIYGSSGLERQVVSAIQWDVAELVLVHSLIGHGTHRHLGRWPLMGQGG